jgi:dihydroorotase
MGNWVIKGGRVLDPAAGRDEIRDIAVSDGVVIEPGALRGAATEVDASGLWVMPGAIDMHVHLREPGNEEAETVETGCRAAARGGFTMLGVMPNTRPPMDSPGDVLALLARGEAAGLTRLAPCACLTRGRLGRSLADLPALARAGARAFTDDGSTVSDEGVLRDGMRIAAALGLAVLDHALDPAAGGCLHDGVKSAALGLAGIPSSAEYRIVERDIRLAAETGCAVHIQHVSAWESVELIRAARARGLRVTGEASPHHLALTDADIPDADTRFKMSPPLRTARDRDALRSAVRSGTLGVLATDHAPHSQEAKARPFAEAANGVIGLETALAVTCGILVRKGGMAPLEWVRRWTCGPAAVLGLAEPSLLPGSRADVTLFDPERRWTVQSGRFASRARNTPFEGWPLIGLPVRTFLAGREVFVLARD